MRYRATVSYDGSDFHGFQLQSDLVTVQGALEAAVTRLSGQPQRVPIIGAGRTDTGVHASGQVIAFDLDWPHGAAALQRAMNANLPPSVAVLALDETRPDFHPRFDAQRRAYAYTVVQAPHRLPLMRRRAWVTHWPLDVDAIRFAAAQLIGRRDFGALGTPPQGNNTVRTIFAAEWHPVSAQDWPTWVFRIEADAFLYRMVRRTVGMLVDVGRGHLSPERFAAILDSGQLASEVTVAPPQGLVLTQVRYRTDEATS